MCENEGRKEGREGGREGGRERGRVGGSEGGRENGRKEGREVGSRYLSEATDKGLQQMLRLFIQSVIVGNGKSLTQSIYVTARVKESVTLSVCRRWIQFSEQEGGKEGRRVGGREGGREGGEVGRKHAVIM